MKKTIAFVLLIALVSAFVAIPASAIPEGCTAVDITDQVKFTTVLNTYLERLPVVRADAQYLRGNTCLTDTEDYAVPGGKTRQYQITDFDQSNCLDMLQFDPNYNFDLAIEPDGLTGFWSFEGTIWPNNPKEGTDANYKTGKSRVVYEFEVSEQGTYEFVFCGCAQIKPGDVGNDAKDRGFCFEIDGGEKKQVNISDSPLVFRAYTDEYADMYTLEDAKNGKDGDPYYYFQMGYVYGITAELSAGKHQIAYYHLEYSGDTVTNEGNGSRLNLAGIFVQKYLDEVDLATYEYPAYVPEESESESESESVIESVEESESVTEPETNEPKTEEQTNGDTEAPSNTETKKPEEPSKGCSSAVVSSVAVVVMACAAAVALKRKH